MLQDFVNREIVQRHSAYLPAIAYYREVAGVDDIQRRAELERLRSLETDSLIPQIQQAIVHYHLGEPNEVLGVLNIDQSGWSQCNRNALCQGYTVLAGFLSEISRLQQKSKEQIETVQNLENHINDLDQQIKALTNIEQQILEREQRSD